MTSGSSEIETPTEASRTRSAPIAVLMLGAAVLLAGLGWFGWSSWRTSALRQRAAEAALDGRFDDAEADLARLMWYRPSDLEALRMRVQFALNGGDIETAQRVLALVPESDPEIERARMTRGLLLMEMFRYREAEAVFREVVRRNPSLDEARVQLAILTGLKRKSRQFEQDLWEYFLDCGRPIPPLRLLALGVATLPDSTTVDKSADEGKLLQRGLEADPTDPEIRPPLARYHLGRGEIDEALAILEPWLDEHPDDPAARVEWLACRLERGETDPLTPWFEPPLPGAAGLGRYWMLRGDWLSRLGRHAEAADAFRLAGEFDGRDPQPRYRLGTTLRLLGQADEAEAQLAWVQRANRLKRIMIEIDAADPDPSKLTEAGRLCAEMGRNREARAWLGLVLDLDPRNAEVRELLARLER